MTDLRKHMNLFESMNFEEDCGEEKVIETADSAECAEDECDDEVNEDVVAEDIVSEEIVDEAFEDGVEGGGLEGMLDPRGLAKLLPEVDDITRFTMAVRKVQKGDNASLSIQETRQLAKAFISLLKDDTQTTMKVLQKLKMVHSVDQEI